MEPLALFDLPPLRLDGEWTIRRIGTETAVPWFAAYHYLGTVPGSAWVYGMFAPDLVACIAIAIPMNPHGVAGRLSLEAWPGNFEIARVAVHPDAPKNTASRSIAAALKSFHTESGAVWVFSYADMGEGHHGGIYQALNAVYVGRLEAVSGYMVDGKVMHPRSVVSRWGSRSAETIARLQSEGVQIEKVDGLVTGKHTYVLPCGPPATARAVRRALERFACPYPKR